MDENNIQLLQQLYAELEASPLMEKVALCAILQAIEPARAFILPEAVNEEPAD